MEVQCSACRPTEASIPSDAMMRPPPCLGFSPYFQKIFRIFGKKFPFSSAKISDDLFLFRISPLFSLFRHISTSCFPKIINYPYFQKFPPCFRKTHLLFTCFLCISFPPYFHHDAFMNHPMHVLDASVGQ